MYKVECEKKVALINSVIFLDEQFSELIARFFSPRCNQDLLNKTIIQNMSISKKREIIKSILEQYPQDVKDIGEWCKCATKCIEIRNAVVHKPQDGKSYRLNINGKMDNYSVSVLLKIFNSSLKKVNLPIKSILEKLKDDNIVGEVVLARISMRNHKGLFNDIYNIQIENSEGEEKELGNYPNNQYNVEEYDDEVKEDIKNWLIEKGINVANIEFEVYLDWFEEPDD